MNFPHDRNFRNTNRYTPDAQAIMADVPAAEQIADEDTRFAKILGANAWVSLSATIRQRFSKRIATGHSKIYHGHVFRNRLSRSGRLLAQLARIIGAPLPTSTETGRATVCVTEDPGLGGQIWQRTYERPGRFPQVIHSAKRFRGATGIEEYVGCGIGMSLRLSVEGDKEKTLVFTSESYFLEVAGRRLRWPRVLSPGVMRIIHSDERPGWFSFTLTLDHPHLGRLLEQIIHFEDEKHEENPSD